MDMRRGWALAIAVSMVVGACGGEPVRTDSSADTDASLASSLVSHCTDVVSVDLGEGTLCVDSGFRPDVDQFSFANWGRSPQADMNVTVQTLIDLFGHSSVCMPGPESECVLRPRTVQQLDDWNTALGGGRCEGMATLSQRMFLRLETASEYSSRALAAADLGRANQKLAKSIVYWWATQFVPEVTRIAAQSRTKTPLELVDDLIRGLANGVGHTIGMYFAGTGHSVTPFAVTRRGADFVVHVYDNNSPGVRREIVISSGTNTWSYANGNSGEESSAVWTGGAGTLELTPMAARQGPFTCPFCADSGPEEGTVVTITNQADAPTNWTMIDAGEDGVIEQTADGWRVTIEGARVEAGKAGLTTTVTVTLPSTIAVASLELRHTAPQETESVVTVRRAGMADVQVRNARSTALIGAARITRPVLRLTESGVLVTAHSGDTIVSLAGATNLATVTVQKSDELTVTRIDTDTVEIYYAGGDVDASTMLEMNPKNATTTQIVATKGTIGSRQSAPSPQKVGRAREIRWDPLPATTSTTVESTTTVPTIEVTLPD